MANIEEFKKQAIANGYSPLEIEEFLNAQQAQSQATAQAPQTLPQVLADALWSPLSRYGRYVGTGMGALSNAVNPYYQYLVNKKGAPLTESQRKYIESRQVTNAPKAAKKVGLAYKNVEEMKPDFTAYDPNISKYGLLNWGGNTIKSAFGQTGLTGAKATAGAASYAVPFGGGPAGQSALRLAGRLAGQGLASGAAYGFGASQPGQEVSDTLKGGATGMVAAPLTYAGGKALAKILGAGKGAVTKVPAGKARGAGGEFYTAKGADEAIKEAAKAERIAAKSAKEAQFWQTEGTYPTTSIPEDTYLSAYTIPSKKDKFFKPVETVRDLIRYGIHGRPDKVANKLSGFSGKDGIMQKLERRVLGNVKGEIDIGNVYSTVPDDLMKISDLSPTEEARIWENVTRMLPRGKSMNKANALDVRDAIRVFEELGHEYRAKSTYLTGNIKDEQIGQVYLDVAQNLEDVLGKTFDKADIQKYMTPEFLAAVKKISPELAKDVGKATTYREFRNVQKFAVRQQQMAYYTRIAKQSLAGKDVGKTLQGVGEWLPSGQNLAGPFGKAASTSEANTAAAVGMNRIGRAIGKGFGGVKAGVGGAQQLTAPAGNVVNAVTPAMSYLSRILGPAMVTGNVPQTTSAVASTAPTPSNINPNLPQNLQSILQAPGGTGGTTTTTGGAGELTKEQKAAVIDQLNQQLVLMMMYDPTNSDAYQAMYDIINESGAGSTANLTAGQRTQLAKFDQGLMAVDEVEKMFYALNPETSGPAARFKGLQRPIKSKLGLDLEYGPYTAYLRGTAIPLIKSLGEVGQLSEADIQGALALLPLATDSKQEGEKKLSQLRTLLNNMREGILSGGGAYSNTLEGEMQGEIKGFGKF